MDNNTNKTIVMTIEEVKIKLREYFEEACEVLGINHQNIPFIYEHIGERFKTVCNACETGNNCLYINEDWISETLRTGFLYDFQYQMYHEARHFYQYMIIADYHARGKSRELPATIKQWEYECKNYIRNEGTEITQKANATQTMEIDANAFANVMLSIKGIEEARAPKEQWKETEKRIMEIIRSLRLA